MSSNKLLEDAQKLLNEYSRVGISQYFKPLKLISVLPGHVICKFEVEDIYLNANRYFHGGLAAVVADALTFIAASTLEDNFQGTSVGMSVRYLKGIKKGEDILVKAEAAKAGKSFFICKADFIDKEGKLVIRGDQTIYRRKSSGAVQKAATDLRHSAKL